MKNNLIFATGFAAFFFFIESVYRLLTPYLKILPLSAFVELFLVFFLFSFIKGRKSLAGLLFFTLFTFFIQLVHHQFFLSFISSYDVYMSFQNINEIESALKGVSSILVSTCFVIAIYFTYKINQNTMKRHRNKNALPIFVLLVILGTLKAHFSHSKIGQFPVLYHSIPRNTYLTSFYLFGKELPKILLNETEIQSWKHLPYKKTNEKSDNKENVIFILGESLTSKRLSALGYKKMETTPYLSSLKEGSGCFITKGISSSVVTAVSLPYLFNIVKRPNAIENITNFNTNLFKMASENGFKTFFISAQEKQDLTLITPRMGLRYVDKVIIPDNLVYDDYLVKQLKSIKLGHRNFIVLHMRGSHFPYKKRYPSEFSKETNDLSLEYNISVKYTDKIIQHLVKELHLKFKNNFSLVFTSDHGEGILNKNTTMHGDVKNRSHHEVPIMLYMPNKKEENHFNKLKIHLSQNEQASHYQLMQVLGELLGYRTLKDKEKRIYYVNGKDIIGLEGMLKINFENRKEKNSNFIIHE